LVGQGAGIQLEPALQTLIDDSHQELVKTSTNASETAFGISCTLGLLASAVVFTIVFLAGTRAWTVLAVVVLISGLISVMVSSLLASRARNATLQTTYERRIRPKIERFLQTNSVTQQSLAGSAATRLPEDSPLLVFLSRRVDQDSIRRGDDRDEN
jgi:ABC-type transport system involved in multi-copper enzyme maturation permease subunit